MERTNEMEFERNGFWKRLKSMLHVDFRRMFTMPLFYILAGVSLAIPILVIVMTTMMDGTTTTDPNTGAVTTIEGFKHVWQAIAATSAESAQPKMDLTGMCNINLLYFMAAVLVCVFVAEDFRSGYSKNLFTVRAKKADYVISKTLVCFVGGAGMLLAYFIGAMIGGAVMQLSFDGGVGAMNVVACMASKVFLLPVFVAIFLLMSVVGKQRLWLSILGSLAASMLLFTMIPMITPLDSGILNVVLCLVGGVLFGAGLGAISGLILRKTSLV